MHLVFGFNEGAVQPFQPGTEPTERRSLGSERDGGSRVRGCRCGILAN